jgi:GNAT superfamily N-acetyltransferase
MELIAQNLRLELIRPDMRGLPAPQWPPGYSVRWFRPGDACHWLRIHHDAEPFDEITPDVFLREFGSDFNRLAERQCFLQDPNGRVIGTGTAWDAEDEQGEQCGRVFWLAILRQHQGRGLGRLLLAAVCQRLAELGHTRARVATSTGRPSAISLYLHFGFQPLMRTAAERERWARILDFLQQSGRMKPAVPGTLTATGLPMGDAVKTALTMNPPA